MTTSPAPRERLVALVLIIFCGLSVILGIIQVVKQTSAPTDGEASHTGGAPIFSGSNRLAYIALDGMIIDGDSQNSVLSRESSAIRTRRLLYEAAKDNNIVGVLLRINSPGGTVGMSQELYNAVMAVRRKKPIVVSMGDVAASGGYYTAAAADKIVANPGTLTASIGVILQSMNLKGLFTDKLGIKAVTVKSGKFKDILSPYREPTSADMTLLQNLINTSYKQFLTAVLNGRTLGMTNAKEKAERIQSITAIADGRVIIGEEAVKVGLVDELGGQEEAKQLLQTLAGNRFNLRHANTLELEEYDPFTVWQLFNSKLSFQMPQASLANTQDFLPLSYKYANQPLWVMEQLH